MNIYQVCINYVNEEDRLLARINTREGQELRFWLTRRLSLAVMPLLEQVAAGIPGQAAFGKQHDIDVGLFRLTEQIDVLCEIVCNIRHTGDGHRRGHADKTMLQH